MRSAIGKGASHGGAFLAVNYFRSGGEGFQGNGKKSDGARITENERRSDGARRQAYIHAVCCVQSMCREGGRSAEVSDGKRESTASTTQRRAQGEGKNRVTVAGEEERGKGLLGL